MTDVEAVFLAGVGYVSRVLLADGPALVGGRTALGVITIGMAVVLAWRVDARAHEAHEPLVSHDYRLSSSVGRCGRQPRYSSPFRSVTWARPSGQTVVNSR